MAHRLFNKAFYPHLLLGLAVIGCNRPTPIVSAPVALDHRSEIEMVHLRGDQSAYYVAIVPKRFFSKKGTRRGTRLETPSEYLHSAEGEELGITLENGDGISNEIREHQNDLIKNGSSAISYGKMRGALRIDTFKGLKPGIPMKPTNVVATLTQDNTVLIIDYS